jgi:hypothetical protein
MQEGSPVSLVITIVAVGAVIDVVISRRLTYWQRRLIEEQRDLIETQADTIIVLEAHVAMLEDRQP